MSLHHFSREAMHTVFEVRCAHDDARYAGQAAHAAFELVERLERDLSRFIGNSDVSRVNALAAGESTRVSAETMDCLDLACRMHAVTGGAFDISLGTGLEQLELVPDEFTVRVHADGLALDLGGIGKGYAVDRVAELLREWGIERALVHGGWSSVLALEPPPDRDGWPLTLSVPGGEAALARLSARQRAFSASGAQKGAHILDPRSGRAVDRRAVWVALPAEAGPFPAAVAEALSTAFMVLSPEEAEALCRQAAGVEAWLFLDELIHVAPTSPPAGETGCDESTGSR